MQSLNKLSRAFTSKSQVADSPVDAKALENGRLPIDVLKLIFANLEGSDVSLKRLTCKTWSLAARDRGLWRHLLFRDYPPKAYFESEKHEPLKTEVNWRAQYAFCSTRKKRLVRGEYQHAKNMTVMDFPEELRLPTSFPHRRALVDEDSKVYKIGGNLPHYFTIYDGQKRMDSTVHTIKDAFVKEFEKAEGRIATVRNSSDRQIAVLWLIAGVQEKLIAYDIKKKKICWTGKGERYLGARLGDRKKTGVFAKETFSRFVQTSRPLANPPDGRFCVTRRDLFENPSKPCAELTWTLPEGETPLACESTLEHDLMVLTSVKRNKELQYDIARKIGEKYRIERSEEVLAFDQTTGLIIVKQGSQVAVLSVKEEKKVLDIPPKQKWQAQINNGRLLLSGEDSSKNKSVFLVSLDTFDVQSLESSQILAPTLYQDLLVLLKTDSVECVDLISGKRKQIENVRDVVKVVGRENEILICQAKEGMVLVNLKTEKVMNLPHLLTKVTDCSYQAGLLTLVRPTDTGSLQNMQYPNAMEWYNFCN